MYLPLPQEDHIQKLIATTGHSYEEEMLERMPVHSEQGDIGLPPMKWSAVMFRKTEDQNGYEATQAGRNCHEATAS